MKMKETQHQLLGKINQCDIAAWSLMGAAMLFVLVFHLLPGLLAGLLVFELVHILTPYIARSFPGPRAKLIAVGLLAAVVVGLLV